MRPSATFFGSLPLLWKIYFAECMAKNVKFLSIFCFWQCLPLKLFIWQKMPNVARNAKFGFIFYFGQFWHFFKEAKTWISAKNTKNLAKMTKNGFGKWFQWFRTSSRTYGTRIFSGFLQRNSSHCKLIFHGWKQC